MFNWKFTALSLVLLVACSPQSMPPIQSDQSTTVTLIGNQALKQHPIRFKISTGNDFMLKQVSVTAPYVRLMIEGKDANGVTYTRSQTVDTPTKKPPIYAIGALTGGFKATNNTSVELIADVPDGSNWVVTAGFYSNKTDSGVVWESKAAFHSVGSSDEDPPIEIGIQTYLVAEIIKQLRNTSFEFRANPPNLQEKVLNLASYQDFVDSFTGFEELGENQVKFTRLDEYLNNEPIAKSPKDVFDIDARAIAWDIARKMEGAPTGIEVSMEGGLAANPQDYRKTPYVSDSYALAPHTLGVRETMAVAPTDTAGITNIFMHETSDTTATGGQVAVTDEKLYGVKFNESTGTFTQIFNPITIGKIKSSFLSTGKKGEDGPVVYLTRSYNIPDGGEGLALSAYSQFTGSSDPIWEYNFDNVEAGSNEFTPVVWKGTGCSCTQFDILYTAFQPAQDADSAKKGIYKIPNNGDPVQFYAAPYSPTLANFSSTGALSKDGSRLYLVNQPKSVAAAELIVIDTATMTEVRKTSLPANYYAHTKVSPVIGVGGTVYISAYYLDPNDNYKAKGSYLIAFNPDGTQKWIALLDNSIGKTADVPLPLYPPVVDYKNNKNQIYATLSSAVSSGSNFKGKILSITDNGSSGSITWQQDLGVEIRGSAIVGEAPYANPTEKYVYVGTKSTGQLISLNASDGKILWKKSPDGTFASGFSFNTTPTGNDPKKGYLFLTTKDGGDNNDIRLRAVKVESYKLATTGQNGHIPAWPKFGGGPGNTSTSQE